MRGIAKKTLVALAASSMAFGMAACSAERGGSSESGAVAGSEGGLIGVSMPSKSLERWNRDGSHLEELLKDEGYDVSLQYADNKVEQQITQIQNMINEGPKVLVVASIDVSALAPVLEQAKSAGIPVIIRPPDPRHRSSRLLRNLRQLQGRPAAGPVHRRISWPQGR